MTDDFVTLTRAAEMLGISPAALKRRIDRGQLPVYRCPTDLRVRLIRRTDLARYAAPQAERPSDKEAA